MRRFFALVTVATLAGQAVSVTAQQRRAVDDGTLAAAGAQAEEWLSHGRDYAETRYSPLDQIHAGNVADLGLAWYYDTGSYRGLEATPLVADGVLYATTSWSNVFALDAETGRELWRWNAAADRERGARACCDVVNRGVALYDGKVFVGVIDGRLAALDAATGEALWDVQTTDPAAPYTITGAPRVVDGRVVIGNGGAELGVRGYVSAYDPATGELLWRMYTVPGNPDEPFESEAMRVAADTWTGEWWRYGGGGTAWDSFAYDAEAGLLYVGTGNGSPWNRDIRSPGGGDNLYLSSILALDVDTGQLVWHYQTTPGETWDYTAVQQLILAELTIDGEPRDVVMQAPKNGFFYVLDRHTGELLSAEPFVHVTWAKGVDAETGRPIETAHARYGREITMISPSPAGGHNWQPMAFNSETGLVYIPAQQGSFPYVDDRDFEHRHGGWNLGVSLATREDWAELPASEYEDGTGESLGAPSALLAWDPVARAARWQVDHPSATNGGVLTTAGNLVFQGTAGGRFAAYSADRGEKLWEVELGHGIIAPPVTYAIGGTQYVSVLVGWGGASALYGPPPTGQYKPEGRLWTFRLGGETDFEPVRGVARPELTPIELEAGAERLADGAYLYGRNCSSCHGRTAVSAGTITDLRYSDARTFERFDTIVRGGAYVGLGMPSFGDWLSAADVEAIRSYILSRRAALLAEQQRAETD